MLHCNIMCMLFTQSMTLLYEALSCKSLGTLNNQLPIGLSIIELAGWYIAYSREVRVWSQASMNWSNHKTIESALYEITPCSMPLVSQASPFTKRKGLVRCHYSSCYFPQKSWGTWICKFCGHSMTAICKHEPQPCSPGTQAQSVLRAAHVQWLVCHTKLKACIRKRKLVYVNCIPTEQLE